VVIAKEEERLGLRHGDEVLRVNGEVMRNLKQFRRTLDSSFTADLLLQHHEKAFKATTGCIDDTICGIGIPSVEQQPFKIEHAMRRLLATSGPVQLEAGANFMVQIARTSLMQSFDLDLSACVDPDGGFVGKTLFIKQDALQYGLRAGDKVLRINGISNLSADTAEALLENAMNVWLECSRDDMSVESFGIGEATLLDDIDIEPRKRMPTGCLSAEDPWCAAHERKTPAGYYDASFFFHYFLEFVARVIRWMKSDIRSTSTMSPRSDLRLCDGSTKSRCSKCEQ